MKNNEVHSIQNLNRKALNSIAIRWEVTRFCNYSCDFCIQGTKEMHQKASNEEKPSIRKTIAESLAYYVENSINRHRIVEIQLIGGEVTALPDFKDLLSVLVNCRFPGGIIFYITTNFSRPACYFSDLFKLFSGRSNRSLFVSASFYSRYTSAETFGNKMKELHAEINKPVNKYFRLRWRLLASMPIWIHSMPKWQNVFISVGWPILDDDSYYNYRKFQMEFGPYARQVFPIIIRDYPVILSSGVQNALKGIGASRKKAGNSIRVKFDGGTNMYFSNIQHLGYHLSDVEKFCPWGYFCDAGRNSFSICPDGTTMRCPALNPPAEFCLGRLNEGSVRLLQRAAVCHSLHCSCNSFSEIEKR